MNATDGTTEDDDRIAKVLATQAQQEGEAWLADFRALRQQVVATSAFRCEPIPFAASREWRFEDGFLRHRTGGFFSVGGLRTTARTAELDGCEQCVILQPETAINGFLLRRRGGGEAEVLFQGRVEPGNVDALQLAPTVQSTEANYRRRHGGGATPFLEPFLDPADFRIVYDELQSEEATRYYGKYNRNVVIDVGEHEFDLPPNFRWYDRRAIGAFVVASNVLNTDARSVLAGLDWRSLAAAGQPFTQCAPGSFGARLRSSYEATPDRDDASDAEVLGWLQRLRVRSSPRHTVLPLHGLRNWVVEADVIREREREHGFCVRQFAVHASGREVSAWDQPLVDSDGVGRLVLAWQERGGVLRVLVSARHEIGFLEGVQCGASLTVVPGADESSFSPVDHELLSAMADGSLSRTVHACRQSEEGGRFWRDENDYRIVELDPAATVSPSPFHRWLTLAQVRRLIGVPGTFGMEFRGALAMLLHWV